MSASLQEAIVTRTGRMLFVCCLLSMYLERPALAEWYVAGHIGVNFADQLTDISGTGNLTGFRAPNFDLKNAVVYGAKVGVFPGNGWFGLELDAFNSQPNIKNLDDVPGIHMRVTNVGINLIARYPGVTFQPYIGIGTGAAIARIGDSATTKGDTDVASVLKGFVSMAGAFASKRLGKTLWTEFTDDVDARRAFSIGPAHVWA